MRMRQRVRTGLGHGGITCVLQTQFSSYYLVLGRFLTKAWVGGGNKNKNKMTKNTQSEKKNKSK